MHFLKALIEQEERCELIVLLLHEIEVEVDQFRTDGLRFLS